MRTIDEHGVGVNSKSVNVQVLCFVGERLKILQHVIMLTEIITNIGCHVTYIDVGKYYFLIFVTYCTNVLYTVSEI